MSEYESGHTEIPDNWIKEFKSEVARDRTARGAWREIGSAGLEEGALFLLWGFAGGAEPDLAKMHQRAENTSDLLKAAHREEGVAQNGRPKRAHDDDLFRRRAASAREGALSSEWAMPTPETSKLRDELARVKAETGRQPTLPAVRKALTKAAGKRSPVKNSHLLLLLQGYAEKFAVKLGIKRLVALASCADRNTKLDEGRLGSYLRSATAVKDQILGDTLPTLPPPSLKKR
jgi:hypothetical protein